MKLTQPRMYPKWRTPSRKPFTPEGITLGAEVTAAYAYLQDGTQVRNIGGQLWSAGHSPYVTQRSPRAHWTNEKGWWIVTADRRAYFAREEHITALGQCNDASLFDAEEVA